MEWLPAILILPYLFLLIKIYRSLLKVKPFEVTADPSTFISVIVPCRNEQQKLPILLNCISEQSYPGKLFEVIIVDDNSSDRTKEEITGSERFVNIKSIYNKGIGKKQALRTGINASSGNLIVTTDADCIMGKNWFRTIAAYYEKNIPDMIICPVQIGPGTGFFRSFQELEFLSLQGITAGSASAGRGTMCNGANLAFTREAYLNNEYNLHFEIASGDDIFLLHSLKKQTRSKILWLESYEALVTARSVTTFVHYLKQRKRWISKAITYTDRETTVLGIVTFVTIILQATYLVAALISKEFLPVFLTIFILKSVPDFLILQNTSCRYGRGKLMNWFFPAQIIYPFYVLSVVFYSLFPLGKKNINSPFPKEI
ncbi:MAG: glycosyltransferase [Bacteroidetes bacterium]|nr:MAG: glycosyltransferase [Bacteroidota bacterium]